MDDTQSKGAEHPDAKPGKCNYFKKGMRRPCRKDPVKGRVRCEKHGGQFKRGSEHHHFVHGMRSAYFKPELLAQYEAIKIDPELMKLDTDIVVMEMLISARVERMKEGGRPTEKAETAMMALIDQRRRLIEARDKQHERLGGMIPAADVMNVVKAMGRAVRAYVKDEGTLLLIQSRFKMICRNVDTTGADVPSQALVVSGG